MKKELELWQFVAAKLEQKQPVTLLVVAESKGSSPGRQGFKMAVCGDEMRGSIGGGVMEVGLVESAKRKMENIKSTIIDQVHRKNAENSSGMICSGKQTVIFRKLRKSDLKTVKKIIGALEKHEPEILRITNREFVLLSDAKEKPLKSGTQNFTRIENDEFIYEEKLGYSNHLYIVGGGHCALALSELMSKLDFRITLFDDRPNLNTLKKNKFAHKKIKIKNYENISEYIPTGDDKYVVVMTLGFASDEIVIRKLLDKKFKYFGVLGSKAKMKILLMNLEREGFAKNKLSRISTPIGLPINSRTPEEIAVSIAAEIITVKNS